MIPINEIDNEKLAEEEKISQKNFENKRLSICNSINYSFDSTKSEYFEISIESFSIGCEYKKYNSARKG